MITKNDIEKLTAEVAEKSIKTISGSNIKIQSGIITTTAGTSGTQIYKAFDEPFDEPPVVVLTAMRNDGNAGWYARLMTRTAEGFDMVCYGNAVTPYSISVMWLAIGTKI